jgi:anti-sigma B factor antagonist
MSTLIATVNEPNGVVRVTFLVKELLDEALIFQVSQDIGNMVETTGDPRLVLDFTGVKFMSSAALGALISIRNRMDRKGGQLRLSNLDKQILQVFQITKLNQVFRIMDSNQEALASFR